MNKEGISYGTYEIDTCTEIIDTVMNLINRATVVEMIWDKFIIANTLSIMYDK